MCNFAFTFVEDRSLAEDIVQDVFVKCWSKFKKSDDENYIKGYLFKATKNQSIEYLRKKKRRLELKKELGYQEWNEKDEQRMEQFILMRKIMDSIEDLPDKCKEIFILSKLEGLTYQEIASVKNISKKTVENQMSIALKKIKSAVLQNWNNSK